MYPSAARQKTFVFRAALAELASSSWRTKVDGMMNALCGTIVDLPSMMMTPFLFEIKL